MWKRNDLVITILAMVFAFVLASQAQERPGGGPPVFRPERPMGPERPLPAIKEYARQLRERAREAQELADQLRRQAEELDQLARQGPMPGMRPGLMDPMQGELAVVKEAAEHAEREGRHEEAMEMRRHGEKLMDQMRSRKAKPGMEERQFPELRERIERLQNQAREAEAGGREEEARRLREEAEAVEVKMKTELEARNMAANLEAMRGKVAVLREQSVRAKNEGRYDEAGELWEKAENIERESKVGMQKIERFKIESQLKHMRMMAERAEKRGEIEKAEALAREARELEQYLQSPKLKGGPDKGGDEMPRMVEELRQENKRLRQEMEELRKQGPEREPR